MRAHIWEHIGEHAHKSTYMRAHRRKQNEHTCESTYKRAQEEHTYESTHIRGHRRTHMSDDGDGSS